MLTRKEIKKMAGETVYNRGLAIWNFGGVQMWEPELLPDGQVMLSAEVQGSGRRSYAVRVCYDQLYGAECECTCPAFEAYPTICKHCVAMLLEIESSGMEEMIWYMLDYYGIPEFLKEAPHAQKGERIKRQTTEAVKGLLMQRSQMRLLPLKQSDIYGKVMLEPILRDDLNTEVWFRIGLKKKYVLKDVISFAKAIEEGKEIRYGKQLSFVHSLDMFHKDSKPLVRFILDWVRRNKDRHIRYSYYYSYEPEYEKVRYLSCDEQEFDDLVDAAEKTGLYREVDNSTYYPVICDKKMELVLKGREDGLYLALNIPGSYMGSRYLNLINENTIERIPLESFAPARDFFDCLLQLQEREAYIQSEDLPQFCRELLPALQENFSCEIQDFDAAEYALEEVSFEIYLDMPQKDWISCEVLGVYGEKKYSVYGNKKEEMEIRNLYREMQTGEMIGSYFSAFDEKEGKMFLDGDEDKIYELLVEGIPKMQTLGEVFISDRLKRLQVESVPKVKVGVSVMEDGMELTMLSEDMGNEQLLEILSKYTPKRKYYRLKNGNFVNIEGDGIRNLAKLQQSMNLTASQMKVGKVMLPKYRALYMDSLLQESQDISFQRSRSFKALIRNMKTVEENDFEIPASLEQVLREYQKEGFLWIKTLKANGFAGILADDMGLGKTLQVISFLLSEAADEPTAGTILALIVTPASLVYNWESEFARFAPKLPIRLISGTQEQRAGLLREVSEQEILVTSYDLLKRDIELYEGLRFRCQIIDEAQYIKNQSTQAAKAVKCVNAGFRLALTGTPIENRLSELWSIFDYLMPGFLYTYKKFREELEIPVVQNQDEDAATQLQKMVRPFVLRRLKKDVLRDLPDKLEENYFARLEGEQRDLYDAHVKRMRILLDEKSDEEFKQSKIQILSELTKLRQICCDPALLFSDYRKNSAKLDMCMELVTNAVSGGHKILLFSQFTSMLARIEERLRKSKISFYTLTGSTDKKKRRELVEKFNRDDTAVFCISLKAGGTGLNLTAADIVIHYDPWWNEAVQNQATDRAHRIGQKNVVNVYRLLTRGTIEERIMEMQEKKKALSDQILSGDGMSQADFSKEELLELLG